MIAQSVAASPRQEGLSVSVPVAYLAHMLQREPCLPTKTDRLVKRSLLSLDVLDAKLVGPHSWAAVAALMPY
jgi:hypothetical protein